MTKTDWQTKIAEGRKRVEALQADLAAGMSEADAAHRNGFLTKRDVDNRVLDALRRNGGAR